MIVAQNGTLDHVPRSRFPVIVTQMAPSTMFQDPDLRAITQPWLALSVLFGSCRPRSLPELSDPWHSSPVLVLVRSISRLPGYQPPRWPLFLVLGPFVLVLVQCISRSPATAMAPRPCPHIPIPCDCHASWHPRPCPRPCLVHQQVACLPAPTLDPLSLSLALSSPSSSGPSAGRLFTSNLVGPSVHVLGPVVLVFVWSISRSPVYQ